MAFIGLRHPVVAKLQSHTPGSLPTYQAGMVIGKAIQANLTITRNSNPLHGDDGIAEDDNSITGMSLEMGVDDLSNDVQVYMGILDEYEAGQTADGYVDNGDSSPELGVGYVRTRRKAGVTSWEGNWIFRGVFGPTNENTTTKGQNIEWQTPTITGNAMATVVDGTGKNRFRRKKTFTSAAEAEAWIDGIAGITAASGSGTGG